MEFFRISVYLGGQRPGKPGPQICWRPVNIPGNNYYMVGPPVRQTLQYRPGSSPCSQDYHRLTGRIKPVMGKQPAEAEIIRIMAGGLTVFNVDGIHRTNRLSFRTNAIQILHDRYLMGNRYI